jgi:hypothetical protein
VTRLAKVRKTSKRIGRPAVPVGQLRGNPTSPTSTKGTQYSDARRQRCGQRPLSMREATRDAGDLRI